MTGETTGAGRVGGGKAAAPSWGLGLLIVIGVGLAYGLAYSALRLSLSDNLPQDDVTSNVLTQTLALGYVPRQPPLHEWLVWSVQQLTGPTLSSFLLIKYGMLTATIAFLYLAATRIFSERGFAVLAGLSPFFLFQFAFADTASTVTSGAMVGRTGFKGDILYSTCVSGFIYPIFGHWVWGPGGWLGNTMGWFHGLSGDAVFRDFAGSTVVHTVGGFIALAGCITLGPRLGRKFKRDGGGPTPAHDLTMGAIGGVILWFGWYGFNPGSTLSAMDWVGIGRVAANTTLAACSAGLVGVLFVYPRSKKWDLGMSINGFLGGLVAITCPCYWVSPAGALMIGAIAGIVVPLGVDFMEHRRWDDPIGAVAVHGFCGIWGTLSLGLFATGQFGIPTADGADTTTVVKGLFYGGGADQLKAQMIGSLTCVVVVFTVAMIVMKAVAAIRGPWSLRVEKDGELEGLDIFEHGTTAYHTEFGQGMTYTSPTGQFGMSRTFGSRAEEEDDPSDERAPLEPSV